MILFSEKKYLHDGLVISVYLEMHVHLHAYLCYLLGGRA